MMNLFDIVSHEIFEPSNSPTNVLKNIISVVKIVTGIEVPILNNCKITRIAKQLSSRFKSKKWGKQRFLTGENEYLLQTEIQIPSNYLHPKDQPVTFDCDMKLEEQFHPAGNYGM